MENKIKSCLKYPGGKARLISYILENMPKEYNNYYEPFVGGASVVLGVITRKSEQKSYNISDINKDLINCYNVIKYKVDDLIKELSDEKYKNECDVYYKLRVIYNENDISDVERAALLIYLNKTCYNGLMRHNLSGKYNVPFGKMKNPKICDEITLRAISDVFKNANINIRCCSYSDINLEEIKSGDFVYMDPPYHGTFTGYTKDKFGEDSQILLKEYVDMLTEIGVKVMLSNSGTDFIKELYKDYNQVDLTIKYSLGGKNAGRGERSELLIKNYD